MGDLFTQCFVARGAIVHEPLGPNLSLRHFNGSSCPIRLKSCIYI